MEFVIGQEDKLNFYFDKEVMPGVRRVIDKVRGDVESVFGINAGAFGIDSYREAFRGDGKAIYVSTLGVSDDIPLGDDEIEVLSGRRESYAFVLGDLSDAKKPVLYIIGSDKRGTIYGLFHLSELMGVSPWVHMADVRPVHLERLVIASRDCFISREPSVKYRGFFINDEWPSFGNWTMEHFNGFNARMYDNIFELILRLKGNYLWPAMWTSNFSLDGPGLLSAELADEYGIVMSNSHHEPCSRHSEEWDLVRGEDSIYGNDWNFDKNKEGLTNYWRDGLKRNSGFENIITVGMRGERDSEVLGREATLKENIDYLKEVIDTQKDLIKEVYEGREVPMMLAIYKEVEKYYLGDEVSKGLKEWDGLDGITLMLCEDNQGNMRRLPDKLNDHKGGYGMYYHFDYHGDPVSYEWVNSTYLPKVCEQMSEAYDKGVRDIWIVNVGDVKTLELPISYFFDLAYDYESYGIRSKNCYEKYLNYWVNQQFGNFLPKRMLKKTEAILDGYTYLSSMRKPECLYPSTLHYANYGESRYIYGKVMDIKKLVDEVSDYVHKENLKDIESAFYELVEFPSRVIANLYEMMIMAGLNKNLSRRGMPSANFYARAVEDCYKKEKELIDKYHSIEGGKWNNMMLSAHVGFANWNEEENLYPSRSYIWPADKERLVVYVPLTGRHSMGGDWSRRTLILHEFLKPLVNSQKIIIENAGNTEFLYSVTSSCDWIMIDKEKGRLDVYDENKPFENQEEITISIDREKLKALYAQEKVSYFEGTVMVTAGNKKVELLVLAAEYREFLKDLEHVVPVIEDSMLSRIDVPAHITDFDEVRVLPEQGDDIGLAIEADEFSAINNDSEREMVVLKPYGKYKTGVKALGKSTIYKSDVTYDIEIVEEGDYELTFITAPSNPITSRNTLKLSVLWNGHDESIVNMIDDSFAGGVNGNNSWYKDIFAGEHRRSIIVHGKEGMNHLALKFMDDGIVLLRILVKNTKTKWCKGFIGPIN